MVVTPPVMPKRLAPAALVLVAGAATLSTPAAASGPSAPPIIERWSSELGWVELPSRPAEAPTPAWEATFERSVDTVVSVGDVIVVAERDAGGFVLTRIDPRTGSGQWEREVPADELAELELYIAQDGSVVLANVSQPDRGDPDEDVDAWSSAVLDAADGRPVWQLDAGRIYDGHMFGDVVVLEGLDSISGVEVATGTRRWELDGFRTMRFDDEAGVAVVADGYDTILGIDPQSGDELWTSRRDRWIAGVGDTVLAIDATDGGLAVDVIDVLTGQQADRVTVDGIERFEAAWSGGDDLVVIVGAADDSTVSTDLGDESSISVGIDLRSGVELWRSAEADPSRAVRVDGAIYLVDLSFTGTEIFDAATGEMVSSAEISSETGDVYPDGPYVYHNVDGELRAASLPDLAEAWHVDLGDESHLAGDGNGFIWRYLIPIDGGFIAVDRDAADDVVLRGFLAA